MSKRGPGVRDATRHGCPGWGGLYAVLAAAALLCLAGYRLGSTPRLAVLLQVAVVLLVLGLLAGWLRVAREAAHQVAPAAAAGSRPPFSVVRVPLGTHGRAAGRAAAAVSQRRRERALRLSARRLP
jgi:hypothetical protein